MPDKSQDDRPTETPVRTPQQPPKEPQQDYSALPQKPIKLKPDISLPPALKKRAGNVHKAKQNPPKPAKKAAKKTPVKPAAQPTTALGKISPQAREIAAAAAADEGVALHTWLENLILNNQQTGPEETGGELGEIKQSLQLIAQRLEHLENQRGFWSRFWEQFMEPLRRQQ